jgi:23S rRNA (adenine2503-C2)-methyltransferase
MEDVTEIRPEFDSEDKDDLTDILNFDLDEMRSWMAELGERSFRADQLFQWLHLKRVLNFEDMTNLSKSLREKISTKAVIRAPLIESVQQSSDGTRKYQLRTYDNFMIEAVFIPNASTAGRNTLCISSQVGCAMGCRFCATAAIKLKRHLSAGEIASQLYIVLNDLEKHGYTMDKEKPHAQHVIANLVYMGMGEPLHNVDGVIGSVRLLGHENGLNYSPKRITVSTSGLVKNMLRLGEETDVQLAVSLNATTDEVRDEVMPVNRKWKIRDLLDACRSFPLKAGRRVTFEYVMLAGVNDSDEDAKRLIRLMRGLKSKINLIPFNPHPLAPYKRPSKDRVLAFQRIVGEAGYSIFIRTTRGDDIDAACGMLGGEKLKDARADGLVSISS